MVEAGLAAVLTYLLIGIGVHEAEVARATYIGTIGTVVPSMALAEPIRAVALPITVVRAVMDT